MIYPEWATHTAVDADGNRYVFDKPVVPGIQDDGLPWFDPADGSDEMTFQWVGRETMDIFWDQTCEEIKR